MREWILRPGALAAMGAIAAGALIVAFPAQGLTVLRYFLIGVAVGAGLFALAVHVPRGSVTRLRLSPFESGGTAGLRTIRSRDVARIASRFGRARRRIPDGPALPPESLEALQTLLRSELAQMGIDPESPAQLQQAGALLSAQSWAILTAPERTRSAWAPPLWPNAAQVARVVDSVLVEIEGLHARDLTPQHPPTTSTP